MFAGQYVGIREVADKIWLVSFMQFNLGFFDEQENRVEPVSRNPFAPKLLPMSSEQSVTYVPGGHLEKVGGPYRIRTYDQLIKSQLLYQLS